MGDTGMRYIAFGIILLLLATNVAAYHNYDRAHPYTTPYYREYSRGYDNYGGYRVTAPGPYPYPPTYRYVEDQLLSGHYSGFTGRYHSGYTGTPVSRNWHGYAGSNAVPPRYYPYYNGVHFE